MKQPFDVGQVAIFSESAMNQSNGVIELPLQKQWGHLRLGGNKRRRLCGYANQQLSGLFQIALGLINSCFKRDRVGVIRNNVQHSIVGCWRSPESPKHAVSLCG